MLNSSSLYAASSLAPHPPSDAIVAPELPMHLSPASQIETRTHVFMYYQVLQSAHAAPAWPILDACSTSVIHPPRNNTGHERSITDVGHHAHSIAVLELQMHFSPAQHIDQHIDTHTHRHACILTSCVCGPALIHTATCRDPRRDLQSAPCLMSAAPSDVIVAPEPPMHLSSAPQIHAHMHTVMCYHVSSHYAHAAIWFLQHVYLPAHLHRLAPSGTCSLQHINPPHISALVC